MKQRAMKRFTGIVMMLGVAMALTGCGASYVRKDIGPEVVNAKKYGVVLTNFRVNGQGIVADSRLPFVRIMQTAITDELTKHNISAQILHEQGDFKVVASKFADFATKPGSRSQLNPENDYGDLRELYNKNDIDVLLVVTTDARGQNSTLQGAVAAFAAGYALQATTGAMLPGSRPTTYQELLALTPDGKVLYADWKVFTGGIFANKGDVTRISSAWDMETTMIDRYLENVVKK